MDYELEMVNSGAVELLDNSKLLGQLAGLERRTGRSGKDSIDHRRGGHDDLGNSAAGALVHAVRSIGLATRPDTFKRCLRAASIPSFDLRSCYLFGGTFPGVKDVCCGNCIGNQFAIGARQAHAERTGEHIPIRVFYSSHISGNGPCGTGARQPLG